MRRLFLDANGREWEKREWTRMGETRMDANGRNANGRGGRDEQGLGELNNKKFIRETANFGAANDVTIPPAIAWKELSARRGNITGNKSRHNIR